MSMNFLFLLRRYFICTAREFTSKIRNNSYIKFSISNIYISLPFTVKDRYNISYLPTIYQNSTNFNQTTTTHAISISRRVARLLNHAISDFSLGNSNLFSLRLSNKITKSRSIIVIIIIFE